jgi:flagellar biosynthesis protein FlhF
MIAPSPVQTMTDSEHPERYRFLVGSAAEAVGALRDRFGTRGRVVSVQQVGGSGFGWFLKKPRLEVVVEIGSEKKVPADDPETWPKPTPSSNPAPNPAPNGEGNGAAEAVLRALGFDRVMIERIRVDLGAEWASLSKADVVARTGGWLRDQCRSRPSTPMGNRRVFIGGCGAGKTTALCKLLAREVFMEGRSAAVLKLDAGQPNASDGLAAFCEVLGVPLFRSPVEAEEIDDQTILYLDLPGMTPSDPSDVSVCETLDRLRIDSRVLVVNAAYDSDLIAEALTTGDQFGATHVVYTHLDELRGWGKLWRFVLHRRVEPLFLSSGPNLAGDMEDDPVTSLLNRTFTARRADRAGLASKS